MIVMRVLLFVLHVCMLRECMVEGDGNAGVGWMRCGECRTCGRYMWIRYCV